MTFHLLLPLAIHDPLPHALLADKSPSSGDGDRNIRNHVSKQRNYRAPQLRGKRLVPWELMQSQL